LDRVESMERFVVVARNNSLGVVINDLPNFYEI
jgi:hypothetical protein